MKCKFYIQSYSHISNTLIWGKWQGPLRHYTICAVKRNKKNKGLWFPRIVCSLLGQNEKEVRYVGITPRLTPMALPNGAS